MAEHVIIKKKIKVKQLLVLDLDFEMSLDGLISKLRDDKKKFTKEDFSDLEIEQNYDYAYDGRDDKRFDLMGYRLETDEEFKKRIEKLKAKNIASRKSAKKRKDNKEKKEFEQYKRLHKKFEGKVR